jgi:hypothetical protein
VQEFGDSASDHTTPDTLSDAPSSAPFMQLSKVTGLQIPEGKASIWYFRSIATCMPVWYCMAMRRTALFLKDDQLKKLQALSDKTGAPVAELIRRAIDNYLRERAKELK